MGVRIPNFCVGIPSRYWAAIINKDGIRSTSLNQTNGGQNRINNFSCISNLIVSPSCLISHPGENRLILNSAWKMSSNQDREDIYRLIISCCNDIIGHIICIRFWMHRPDITHKDDRSPYTRSNRTPERSRRTRVDHETNTGRIQ